jgi:hypothetical protein
MIDFMCAVFGTTIVTALFINFVVVPIVVITEQCYDYNPIGQETRQQHML